MELKHLTEAILGLVRMVDRGRMTDPRETWGHILKGDVWPWLADRFPEDWDCWYAWTGDQAIWEDAGLAIAFALTEGRLLHLRGTNNGLCLLIEAVNFLIMDNFAREHMAGGAECRP